MPEQTTLPLTGGPRISRVTIGRLHNLGNYEHVRYEVSVELPPGVSPSSVIGALEQTLADMQPKRPHSAYAIGRAIHALSKPEPKLEDFPADDPDADPWAVTRAQKLAQAMNEREDHARVIAEHQQWERDRAAALKRFDELGGSYQFGGGYSYDASGD